MMENKNSSLTSSTGQFQLISDDESLEDHSGLEEDFQGVTLQINESESITPASPENNGQNPSNPKDIWNEPAVLSSTCTTASGNKNINSTNYINGTSSTNSVPRISITPITPDSPSDRSHCMLTQSPRGYGQGLPNSHSNHYWRPQSPMVAPSSQDEAREFFVYRDSIVQHAIDEAQSLASIEDGDIRGTWLFTEIDHFDMEKERIILLCSKSLVIVKYNFIAMKQEEYRRIYLSVIDKIIVGELAYPERSLTPRIGGLTGGLVGVVKDIIPCVQGTVATVGNVILYRNSKTSTTTTEGTENLVSPDSKQPQGDCATKVEDDAQKPSALSLGNFEPRTRNVHGIRILWNQDVPLNFTTKWNPFTKSIPWITLSSHPLLWHKGGGGGGLSQSFDIDSFSRELIDILSHSSGDSSPICRVEYTPIVIDTYLGLTSLFHNANALGFYKVRGRLSF